MIELHVSTLETILDTAPLRLWRTWNATRRKKQIGFGKTKGMSCIARSLTVGMALKRTTSVNCGSSSSLLDSVADLPEAARAGPTLREDGP